MSSSRETVTLAEAERPLFVGIDLGGTNTKLGLVDNQGRTLAYQSVPTCVEDGPTAAVERMAGAIGALCEQAGIEANQIARVGLATPGTMDIPAGMLLDPPNLPGWEQFPIRQRLSDQCGRPVTFANDAAAAAFGEYWVGSGRQFDSIVLLTLGTGVGGGIIIGELSIDGENSHGAECGHIIIDYNPGARVCGCGQAGHLEAYASATAVVKRVQEALDDGATTSLRDRLTAGEELSPLLVAREAAAGDSFCHETVMETAMYLGVGVVSLMHTIDPGAVILGGAMDFGGNREPLGREFLARVREEVARRAFPTLAERTAVDFASLGGDAGYLGAAGLACKSRETSG